MGAMIAAASRVDVTTHAVSARDAFKSAGRSAWIGITSMNMKDEVSPATVIATMIAFWLGIRVRPLRSPRITRRCRCSCRASGWCAHGA